MKRISRSGLGFPLAAIAAALVICTLAVAAVAGVGSGLGYDTDTEGNPYLEISYTNLELGNETRLYHAIESSGFDYAQKRSMRLLVWSEPQESYLSDNKNISYVLKPDVVEYSIEYGGEKKNGVTLFRSEPIAPEKTVDTYYFRAVISDGEREYYSEVSSFGVLDYIYEKLESLEGDSGEGAKRLRELCNSYLTLSAAMQKAKGYKTDRLADSVMLETNDQKVIDNLKEGMEVICDFGHNVREYTPQTGERAGQVQYINNMRLYSIESVQHANAAEGQTVQAAPQQAVQAAPAEDVDPLPF